MKNIKTSKLMGDDFAQDVYNSYLIQGISEKIAEKNGLGFEKIFNKNLKTTKNQSKENDHAPVDILI
jgi:Rod binding domain-containing protein